MDILTLCNKIELQPAIKSRVLAFADRFDFETVDEQLKGFLVYENMKKSRTELQVIIYSERKMLSENSNIINFQKRFEILDEGEAGTEFIEWIFNRKSDDYTALPENTTLQRRIKEHILSGGVIRDSYGKIK